MSEKRFIKDIDYYIEDGRVVFTKEYLLKKNKCCGSKCENCPYNPLHEKGATK